MKVFRYSVWLTLLISWCIQTRAVTDKSGVKPSTISLPSGAGSIEGLGESFEPQLNTGSSSYGVGISIPPGRAGLQPKIHLAYNSGLGNSFVGLGWALDIPCIKRQTDKGFPTYSSEDVFVFGGEELVPLSNPEGDWRSENESAFQRFRQIDTDNDSIPDAWEMTERDGTRHIFGQYRGTSNRWSVVTDPTPPPAVLTAFDRTFCWALNTTIDLHGNRIEYEYLDPSGTADSSGVLYPSRIRYSFLGGNYQEVRFLYEARSDAFEDDRATFPVMTGKRLIGIEVHSFYDGADHLVRAYDLEYNYHPEDGISIASGSLNLGVSMLKRLVERDRSGNTNNYLPPLLFEYSQMNLTNCQLHDIPPPDLDIGEADGNVQIVDVDGDSLPDIIKTADTIAGEQIVCYNKGEFSPAQGQPRQLKFSPATVVVASSSNFRLSDPNSTTLDVDGDGLSDFIRIDPGDISGKQMYIFHNGSRLDGRGAAGFATIPQIVTGAPQDISFNNPAMRQMDVNFDKQSDFVRIQPDIVSSFYYYYRDRSTENWTQLGPIPFNPDMSGYAITFDSADAPNPHVQLADMNGDRLLDLVYLETSGTGIGTALTVRYWPYAGLGKWGAMHVMTLASGDNFQIDGLDLRDVLVQDLTGDGLADIAVMKSDGGAGSTLELRVNIAGRGWSSPFNRGGLPRYLPRDASSPTAFRQADLNANGSTDLIWRNHVIGDDSFKWLELMPDGKPSLLVHIDNSLGKRTEITYGNAVDDMIRAREAGYPWQTWCPFPMQVVRRIRTSCGLDLDGITDSATDSTDNYVSEFQYRDAYYDGFEREFRGFAFAERTDYGDDFLLDTNFSNMVPSPGWDSSKSPTGQVSAPTLVTRFRYLTGAADGVDNDEYPPGWSGDRLVDEVTPKGGREEEILKGRQVWEETVDPWVLHDIADGGDFDRGCWLALNSTNSVERRRMTPDDYVYTRARQEWTIRRLYRPNDSSLAPPGRFASESPAVRVLDGLGGSGRSVSFAFVSSVTNEIIEANTLLHADFGYPLREPIVTAQTGDYDNYGNQIVQRDFGVVNDASFDDERFTSNEYALQGEALSRWIINKPSRVRTTDENGVFVSDVRNYYDGDPFVGLGLKIMGSRALLNRVEQVVTDVSSLPPLTSQSDRPGDPRLSAGTAIQKSRMEYDAYGNSLVTLDPLATSGDLNAGHNRQIGYDSAFKTYPVTETIVVGNGSPNLAVLANYDPGFGVITNSTDFNSNVTSYEYDSFARLVAIVKPYDSSTFPTALFEYLPGDPNRARVYAYDRAGNLSLGSSGNFRAASRVVTRLREHAGQPGTFVTVSFTDGLGRKLADVKEGDAPGQWIVSGAQSYDRRMTPQNAWLPYDIVSGTDDSSPPQFGELWPTGRPPLTDLQSKTVVKTDKRYDPLGREILAINPSETFAAVANENGRTRSMTQLLPLEKRLFDENDSDPASPDFNTPMVQLSDGLGRLIKVLEVVRLNDDGTAGGGLAEWPTRYRYDLNDNLIHITDSQNNEKWFRYDGLGRKLFMNDPDRGTMTYTYDDASNLRETIDAKSQQIQYTYDGVNRLLTEDYLDALGRVPDVAYHYDAPYPGVPVGDGTFVTADNSKGMLAWVQDLSGEEHTSYDARGRVEFVIKRIPDPQFLSATNLQSPTPLVSYRTGFTYDSLDRMNALIYADNDQIGYNYNARNLLRQITGGVNGLTQNGLVISNILYRPSDQLQQIDYGNGVRTTYNYDPRLRLTSLLTISHPETLNSELINFAYDFDGVSNIKAIHDNRPLSSVPAGDPRRNTQLFQYDDLYRITYAGYAFGAPGSTNVDGGSIHYRYDRIGNMLAQNSDIAHLEKGLSVTDLGGMSYGGASGKAGRIGRGANEPAGPHALTALTNSNRAYPYDANGNMTQSDGVTNSWDFKDRLIAVENSEMRAEYSYDYTDRRIIKRVWPKNLTNSQHSALSSQPSTVLYPDKYFEVREHDAPTKYVWNGNTRVARVTGSFTTNQRAQRFRLWPGWNLVSLAVTANSALEQLTGGASVPGNLQDAYHWNATSNCWETVAAHTTLLAGTVLWLRATTNTTTEVTGTYTDPVNRIVTAGASFQPGAGLEAWPFTNALLMNSAAWKFDGASQIWCVRYDTNLFEQSGFPVPFFVGTGFMMRADVSTMLEVPESGMRIHYYHQDHLGSLSVLVDSFGESIEECANYAFGESRENRTSRGSHESYGYSQKERDQESGLDYFEARFYLSAKSRFTRPDPEENSPKADRLIKPQRLNAYSFCANRPIVCVDPTGCSENEEAHNSTAEKVLDKADKAAEIGEKSLKQLEVLPKIEHGLSRYSEARTIYEVGKAFNKSPEAGIAKVAGEAANLTVSTLIRTTCPAVTEKGAEFGAALGAPEAGIGAIPGAIIGGGVGLLACTTTSVIVGSGVGDYVTRNAEPILHEAEQKGAEATQKVEQGLENMSYSQGGGFMMDFMDR
jgi:RHS repeat-associated protein